VRLGDADDPTSAEGLLLGDEENRPARTVSELPGGRLAVWLSPGFDRVDLHLVDVETGDRRLLAADVTAVALGGARALVIARVVGHSGLPPGDLLVLPYDGGGEIRLGRNVTEFALEPPCAGCDPLAPGTTAGFAVQARVPFAHDGLYVTGLP
jgi:hypothetical protein